MDQNKITRLLAAVGILAIVAALGMIGYSMVTRAATHAGGFLRSTSSTVVTASDSGAFRQVAVGELRGFTAISTAGGWKITIEQGAHSVEVLAAEGAAELVRVSERSGTLHLELAPGTIAFSDTLEARITVPDLRRMEIRGAASVRIVELDLSSFALEIDGAANVTAVDTTIDSLDLVVNGAANIDLSKASVVNARVSLDGASNLEIAMDGGTLSGALRGLGNVTYTGRVSEESIRVEGIGRVRSR